MSKESLGISFFRFVFGFVLVLILCLIYWSTSLLEKDVKTLHQENSQIQSEISSIKTEILKEQSEILRKLSEKAALCAKAGAIPSNKSKINSNDTPDFPNLLEQDPFYEKTLPKLLGDMFKPEGTLKTATVGKPDNLHPFSGWANVSSWHDLCSVSLAKTQFGIYETMVPDMALRIEERMNETTKAPEFWVFLRKDLYWQPLKQQMFPENLTLGSMFLKKTPVTAADFKFFYDAMMNSDVQEQGAVSLRTYYGSVEELQIIDDYTFVVRWKAEHFPKDDPKAPLKIKYMAKELTGGLRPLPCHVYQYFSNGKKIISDSSLENYRTNSVWAQNFSQHWAKNIIVSCGPWIFEEMTDQKISFTRNGDFYNPLDALADKIHIYFKNTPDNIWQEFKENHLDDYSLQPDQLGEYESFLTSKEYLEQKNIGSAIKRLDYVMRVYNYIGWNSAKPQFNSSLVRRAMTMAIDRKRIVDNYLNGLGIEITGPFYRYSPAYDPTITPIPFSLNEARRILESEGWTDSDGSGVRSKLINGIKTPFRFTLTYFVKNQALKAICEYIATTLKSIEVECVLHGVDVADLSNIFEDKNFDAICLGWSLGTPPDDPRQLWYSSGAKEKGSSNAVGFSNKEADKIIDALDYEYDPKKREQLYHRFDAIIYEEQPYTFLYTPKAALLYREYLQNVFVPAERQDLIPGANVGEPSSSIYWLKNT